MSARNVLESQQSALAPVAGRTAAGCWKLAPGRALSLHPRETSVLEIAQGRVWLTLRGVSSAGVPASLPADVVRGVADHVLQAGDCITIAAGQHAVLEVWSPAGALQPEAAFRWDLAAGTAAALMPAAGPAVSSAGADWERGVVQPLRDLVQALAQGGRATGQAGALALRAAGRLAWGITRFALFRIAAPRERTPA